MRRTIGFLGVVALMLAMVGVFGDDVAKGQTEIHVTTVTGNLKWVTADHGKEGFGAADRNAAWEPLFAEDQVTRVGKAYWDCVGMEGTSGRAKKMMCFALWELEGGQITLQYVQRAPRDGVFADFTFPVTGGTGIYANATGDGTFTGFEEYGDFVITLAE